MRKILLTCPPMIGISDLLKEKYAEYNFDITIPEFTQIVPEKDLKEIIANFDGWIIGDDPASRAVFEKAKQGRLVAAVKWGVGVDNVDFQACAEFGIPIENTPGMFGNEVADVAIGYIILLARQLHIIDQHVRKGNWYKYRGISLVGKKALVIGYGDIGKNTVKRLLAFGIDTYIYDPYTTIENCKAVKWPLGIANMDFLVFTCKLTTENYHMFDKNALAQCKAGVYIINVARGPLIDEKILIDGLKSGIIGGAGLDVFENEPIARNCALFDFSNVILGSHNGSNTEEAVFRTSLLSLNILHKLLEGIKK